MCGGAGKEEVHSAESQIILILPILIVTPGFWVSYLGLFLSLNVHAGLLYCYSKGLNGALNCCSAYRGEVLSCLYSLAYH